VLPPKIGEGVFGSSSGGVNPTGASVVWSVAAALIVRENLRGFEVEKERVEDCFHGAVARSLGLRPERGGVKREAWVAIAIVG